MYLHLYLPSYTCVSTESLSTIYGIESVRIQCEVLVNRVDGTLTFDILSANLRITLIENSFSSFISLYLPPMANISSRVLALGTLAGIATLGVVSGAFGAFYTTIQSNMTCGYGYVSGYGYGYDCNPIPPGTSNGGWVSGGGNSGTPIITTSGTLIPGQTPSVVTPSGALLFPNFLPHCGGEVKNLTDSRLTQYYKEINVINTTNGNRRLTRAEFLKLAINAAGIDVSKEVDPVYSDVKPTHTLKKYIAYATRNGIVSGQNGAFRPDDGITRAEAAKVFVKGTKLGLSQKIDAFADVSPKNTLAVYIQTAFDSCILHGRRTINGQTTAASGLRYFEPNDGITLSESAKVLFNLTHQ